MSEVRGNLLIGGMSLKNVLGSLEQDSSSPAERWWGELLIEPYQIEYLELGRTYRLELDDGRAGNIAIRRVDCAPGQRKLHVAFEGLSDLHERIPIRQDELLHVAVEPA